MVAATANTDKCLMVLASNTPSDATTEYGCISYDTAGTTEVSDEDATAWGLTEFDWAATTEAAAEEDDATDEESTDDAAADGASNLVAGAAAMVALMVANI